MAIILGHAQIEEWGYSASDSQMVSWGRVLVWVTLATMPALLPTLHHLRSIQDLEPHRMAMSLMVLCRHPTMQERGKKVCMQTSSSSSPLVFPEQPTDQLTHPPTHHCCWNSWNLEIELKVLIVVITVCSICTSIVGVSEAFSASWIGSWMCTFRPCAMNKQMNNFQTREVKNWRRIQTWRTSWGLLSMVTTHLLYTLKAIDWGSLWDLSNPSSKVWNMEVKERCVARVESKAFSLLETAGSAKQTSHLMMLSVWRPTSWLSFLPVASGDVTETHNTDFVSWLPQNLGQIV